MSDLHPHDLIGIWDTDAPDEYASHSSETLVFKPDGTGRFETSNFVLCSADLFHWTVATEGRLTLHGYKTLAIEEKAGQPVEELSDFDFVDVPYALESELTSSAETVAVLVIQFGEDWMPDRYWLVRRDLAGYEEPPF